MLTAIFPKKTEKFYMDGKSAKLWSTLKTEKVQQVV